MMMMRPKNKERPPSTRRRRPPPIVAAIDRGGSREKNIESGATKATDAAWVRPAKSRKIVGLEDSVELVRETFVKTEGEVRALVGFSQGATFIALLRRKLPELFENVRKVVSIAGFDPLDEEAYAAAIDDDDDGKSRERVNRK